MAVARPGRGQGRQDCELDSGRGRQAVLVTFLLLRLKKKNPPEKQLKGKAFVAHSLKVQPIVVGRVWWQSRRRPVVHISCGEAEGEPEVGLG